MPNHTKEKQQVIDAISALGRTVTAADVSAKTGLPVLSATAELNSVAAEVGGHLKVSSTGDVVYAFEPGFSNAYLTKGLVRVMQVTMSAIGRFAFYLLKISFGIMLILSLLIVGITIFMMFFSQREEGRRQERLDFFDFLVLREIFRFSIRSGPVSYDYNTPTIRRRDKSNFLLNCFSFLFGDGNPNEGLDEKRWQVIANVIRKNNNVVTADQLAPYTGVDPRNEDGVLPVLVRFNGKPEVTESGAIVYIFPDLNVTAGSVGMTQMPPPYLREFPVPFTNLPPTALKPVYIIAGLNFFGSWFLWWMLYGSPHGNISLLFSALMIYGTLFLLVPVARLFINMMLNSKISERNKQRALYAEALLMPTPELSKKLEESRAYKMREKRIENQDIVYTTEKNALDQSDDLDLKFRTLEAGETFDASPGP